MYHHVSSLVSENGKFIWSLYPTQYEGRAVQHKKKQENIDAKSFLHYYIDLIDQIIYEEGEEKAGTIQIPIFINGPCDIFCGAPMISALWLLPDKTITTCVESMIDKVIVGRIQNNELDYSGKYRDVFLKITQEKYAECRNCIAYYFCKGGCPHWHLRGSVNGGRPQECNLQIEYLKYVIEAALAEKYSFGWYLEKIDLPNVPEEIYKLIRRS